MNEESWLPEIAALPLTGTQFTWFTSKKVQILTQNGRAAAYRSGLRHQLGLLLPNFLLYSYKSTHTDASIAALPRSGANRVISMFTTKVHILTCFTSTKVRILTQNSCRLQEHTASSACGCTSTKVQTLTRYSMCRLY
jgi:hypothetical protein